VWKRDLCKKQFLLRRGKVMRRVFIVADVKRSLGKKHDR
jgi:hypothetical protein